MRSQYVKRLKGDVLDDVTIVKNLQSGAFKCNFSKCTQMQKALTFVKLLVNRNFYFWSQMR